MSLLARIVRGERDPVRTDLGLNFDDWVNYFSFNGTAYPYQMGSGTLAQEHEVPPSDFAGYVHQLYRTNGVVFACMAVRQRIFSEARFQLQTLTRGVPGDLFGSKILEPLERPWGPSSTTGDLLTRMVQDADLAGNAYIGRMSGGQLTHMRPDWVTIIVGSRMNAKAPNWQLDAEVAGYMYQPGGRGGGQDPVLLVPENVAHFAPYPDPLARFRGMPWLTPVIREIMGDSAAMQHKLKFFELGAPQPLDAKVLTPEGWTTMGAVQAGDEVIGSDGRAKRVTGVFPQGERDIFRVTFTDGASTECTDDHLWSVKLGGYKARTLPLSEIARKGLNFPSGNPKWSVDFVEPVEFERPDHVLSPDPYLLGMLLGDGSFRSNGHGSGCVSLSGHLDDADETEEMLTPALPGGVTMKRRPQRAERGLTAEWTMKGRGTPYPNPMMGIVRNLGLYDVIGHDKFIPAEYMTASVGDRVSLLQGLVDSDGSVGRKFAAVTMTTTSETMARQIVDLVGSLGGWATFSVNDRHAKLQYRIRIKRLPAWIVPCRLARKVKRYHSSAWAARRRRIKSIEPVGRKPAQCIRVESDDHLYVTDDYVLTHNTPNTVVTMGDTISPENFQKFVELFEAEHQGAGNAYRTLFFGGGASVDVIGTNMEQLSFKETQGHGETRIAAAAGVPPIIVGLSEGLDAATYSNYGQARRAFADITMRPLWRDVAASLEPLIDLSALPGGGVGTHLWYDDRHIPFLQDDVKDAAEVQALEATTMNTLITAGFTPDDVVTAVVSGDLARLKGKHSGLVSVQLFEPGQGPAKAAGAEPAANGSTGNGKPANGAVPPKLLPAGKPA